MTSDTSAVQDRQTIWSYSKKTG